MKALYFENKKMKILGEYSPEDLINGKVIEGDDIRFSLYTDTWKNIDGQNTKVRKADYLLIDIDNCSLQTAKIFKLRLRKIFSDVTYTLVYTGGGLHMYIPVSYGFKEEDKANYKTSYDELCAYLAEQLNHEEVDNKCFGASKYGRVIGSTNTKYGTVVELLDNHVSGRIDKLSDILD